MGDRDIWAIAVKVLEAYLDAVDTYLPGRVEEMNVAGNDDVAQLDAAEGIDVDRPAVGWVLRLAAQLDRFARHAKDNLEPPCRTARIRIVGADNGKGHGWSGHPGPIVAVMARAKR